MKSRTRGENPAGATGGVTRRAAMVIPVALGAAAYAGRFAWAAGPQKGGILRATTYRNPTSLDPSTSRSGADFPALNPIYDALIDTDPKTQELKPGLAESWEWKDDKSLALTLRQDVVFHDGERFDAEAVKANMDRIKNNPRSTISSDIDVVESVEVTGPYTVLLRLNVVDTTLPAVLADKAGLMSSPKAFTASGDDYDRKPVGTGAMKFVEWSDDNRIVLARNPTYWRAGQPYLDGIEMPIIIDTNTGMRSVVAGQNHLAQRIDPTQVAMLKKNGGVEVSVVQTLRLMQCYINFSRPPFNDARVRQAMNYAIDRATMTRVVTSGLGKPANLYIPDSHWAYDKEAASRYTYDPDKAKKLLADAGFAGGLKLHANYPSDPFTVQRMEIIQSYFSKVGINIEERTVGTISNTNKEWRNGVGDIRMAGWSGRPDPSITYSLLYAPDGFFNIGNAEPSKELTKALQQSKSVRDVAERKAILAQVMRLEREQALGIPLSYEPEVTVFQPKVKNFEMALDGRPNLQNVYLEG